MVDDIKRDTSAIMSLAMIKMEKNFRAVINKCYPRQPYRVYPVWSLDPLGQSSTLFGFVLRESEELGDSLDLLMRINDRKITLEALSLINRDGKTIKYTSYRSALLDAVRDAKAEVADVSNCLDYLFERLSKTEAELLENPV